MSLLSVRGLSKSYQSRQVVKDVSLQVNSGEIIGLLGRNGAGKTTSFHMIVGLVAPDAGAIYINGQEVSHLSMARRSYLGLGYLPQEASIFRKLTVAENIMAILQTRPHLDETQAKQRLENLLQEFGITHLREHAATSLSGGERRRVEIARSLATEPKILLFDEPFAGVDPISLGDIQKIMRYLIRKHDLGIFITDHNVREMLVSCDRAYIINNGRIIAGGTPAEILQNEQVREVYLGRDFTL